MGSWDNFLRYIPTKHLQIYMTCEFFRSYGDIHRYTSYILPSIKLTSITSQIQQRIIELWVSMTPWDLVGHAWCWLSRCWLGIRGTLPLMWRHLPKGWRRWVWTKGQWRAAGRMEMWGKVRKCEMYQKEYIESLDWIWLDCDTGSRFAIRVIDISTVY